MWRTLTILTLAFWITMTVLLLRHTYVPEGAGFAEIPPRTILKNFLELGATLNTLHIYHRDQKLGHASINQRKASKSPSNNDYSIMVSGLLEEGSVKGVQGQIAWRFDIQLKNLDTWLGSTGQIRLPTTGMILDFRWPPDKRIPEFTLKQNGIVTADHNTIQPMLAQMLGDPAMMANQLGVPADAGADASKLVKVKAREGRMVLAGQNRRGFVLEFSVMDRWQAKAFFTEVGELALITLPEGYRLVEPIIHGLVPDYPDEEETEEKSL